MVQETPELIAVALEEMEHHISNIVFEPNKLTTLLKPNGKI
jgi:hypothetical protein